MPVRLRDIAKDLNLSVMTISRVLRGQTDVSEETKLRVLQRMQQLKYRPNESARGLRTGQAFRIGVLVPRISDPYWAAICQGIIAVFQAAGYSVAISVTDADPEQENAEIERQLSCQVDALILIGSGQGRVQDTDGPLVERVVPLLCIGRKPPDVNAVTVGFDEPEVGRMPAAYLLSRGSRRIAYLRGPRTAIADDRLRGFLAAHREAGVRPNLEWAREIRSVSDFYQRGFTRMTDLLRETVAPDAVMAYNDALAAGARDAALVHGLVVPDQFQVVGCGDDALLCAIGLPLTSVSYCGEELGMRAARHALSLMAGKCLTSSRNLLLSPAMVARSTTCDSPRDLTSPVASKKRRIPSRSREA